MTCVPVLVARGHQGLQGSLHSGPSGLWATPPLAVEPGCEASYLSPAATRSPLVLSLCLSGGPALLDTMSLMLSFTAVPVPPAVLTVSAEDAVKPFGGE